MRRRRWLAWLPVIAIVACQGGPGQPPAVLLFEADPATVRSAEPTTLRWVVTGATSVTISPGIGDVTGTTSTVAHPTVTTTYTLTATNAAGNAIEQLTVAVDDAVDLRGRVLGLDGRAAAGVDVVVLGEGTATTDAAGDFVLLHVDTPYAATVMHPTEPRAATYLGLTAEAPVLLLPGTPTAARHQSSIYGTVSAGTGFPQPAGHDTAVSFGSDATRAIMVADGASGGFQVVGLPWYGPDVEGALHALQWSFGADRLPTHYTGHGYRPLTLRAAIVAHLAQDMALLPIGDAAVSGGVDVPAGYTLQARTLSVVFPEGGWITTATQNAPGAAFSYVTPVVAEATMAVTVAGSGPGGELVFAVRAGVPSAASGVTVALPRAPVLDAPLDGTAGVGYDTEFSWSAPAGGVAVVTFSGPPGSTAHTVVTGATSVSIPDLRELGLDLVAGATYRWQVHGLPLYASVDQAVADDDGFLSSWPFNAFYLPRRDGAWARSLQRQVVIAP